MADDAGIMPHFAQWDEPVSVLAARAVRAGLLRRRAEALWRQHAARPDPARRNAAARERNAFERGVPPTGLREPAAAAFFQRWWPLVRAHTDTDRFRAETLVDIVWRTRDVPGDIVECGSFRGGLGFLFALAAREWAPHKTVHLYDSFEGLPPLSAEDRAGDRDTMFYAGQFQTDDLLDGLRSFLAAQGLSESVELHKGWFDDTLPLIPAERRFSFAHVDCDLYSSAHTCFTHLLPRLASGAGVAIDDYDSFGMYQALWEALAAAALSEHVIVGALKQACFYVTPGAVATAGREDWSPLLANRPYRGYLAGLCGEMIVVCSGTPATPRDVKMYEDLDHILGPGRALDFLERFIAFLYQRV